MVVAAIAFVGTRALALHARDQNERDAALLYARGTEQLGAGQTDAAVASLRQASARDRSNAAYALGYARALRAQGQLASAERALLLLHAEAPDQPDTNLELARI